MSTVPVRLRLALWYSVVLAVTFTAFTMAAWLVMRTSLYGAVDGDLRERAAGMQLLFEQQAKAGAASDLAAAIGEHVGANDALQIRDRSGPWVYRAPLVSRSDRLLLPDPAGAPGSATTIDLQGRRFRALAASVTALGRTYVLEVGSPLDDVDEALRRFRVAMLVALPAMALAASAGGYWLSGRALAPVDAITNAAREITERSLSRRLAVTPTGDELQRLSETLNAMLARLDAAFARITRFTADAAHELRTPIAVMRTIAEVTLRRPRDEAALRLALEQIHGELERTSGLVENLLRLARADAATERVDLSRVDLGECVREACRQAAVLADARRVCFEHREPDAPVWVDGDPTLLQRLFMVLADNAVKYTPSGGSVTVLLRVDSDGAVTEVSDTGIGIARDDLPHIWERFYRCDKVRSSESGGAGLGLAIAKWIADVHDGNISAESVPGEGSTFTVRLPRATSG